MNMSVEKKKYPSALPSNWPTRDEQTLRKSQMQQQHHQQLQQSPISSGQQHQQQQQQQQLSNSGGGGGGGGSSNAGKVDVFYYSRGVRNDASLVPPIRQTASIFKQPVTIYKTQEGKVKDIKHGNQEKPKQLFWEKRLENLRACDPDGFEFNGMNLPRSLRPVGPYVTEETLLQSVATALHVSTQPVTGQTGSKSSLEKNPGVYLNPDQPLVQAVAIAEDDIKRQEERVIIARKKLEEAVRSIYA